MPGQPSNIGLFVRSGTELQVTWGPPVSDGGSAVTSYRVEWDTAPGVREVQQITTDVFLGPNDVQTITSAAATVYEVQSVTTSATPMPAIQTIKSTADMHETIGGTFTLGIDVGNGLLTTGPLQNNAGGSSGSGPTHTTVQEALTAIGLATTVSRTGPDSQGGYTWTVTFTSNHPMPLLTVASSLTGLGASIVVASTQSANNLGGTFALSFRGAPTGPLPVAATDAEVQAALMQLATIDGVIVRRTAAADTQGGYTWHVTFDHDNQAGDLPALVPITAALTGTGSAVTVCTKGSAVAPCDGTTVRGNQIGGHFSVRDAAGGVTSALAYNATAAVVASAIGTLHNGSCTVTRSGPDRNLGYVWTISFTAAQGLLPALVPVSTGLTGTGVTLVQAHPLHGTQQTVQTVALSSLRTSGLPRGSITLTVGGATTASIVIESTCALTTGVAPALRALSTVVDAVVTCASASASTMTFTVTFSRNAGSVAAMALGNSLASGGTGVVTVIQTGTSARATWRPARMQNSPRMRAGLDAFRAQAPPSRSAGASG